MENDKEILELKNNIHKIFISFNKKKEENLKLLEQISELNKIITRKDRDVELAKKELETEKIAKSLITNDGENSVKAKQKITNLVREIDKCISLLNK